MLADATLPNGGNIVEGEMLLLEGSHPPLCSRRLSYIMAYIIIVDVTIRI